MRLTDISIRALKSPEKGAVIFPDDSIPGFGVRVSEGGTKSFVLTHGPRRQRETIGRVGVISLSDARAEAKRRLAEYTLGKEKPRTISWDAAKEEYLEERKPHLKARTCEGYEYHLNRHFRYGATRLSDISPHDLADSLKKLKHSQGTHHGAFCALRAFISWAHRKHYLDRNPMERMETPPPCRPRDRILTDDELRRVWLASRDDTFGRIIKLLILTGQRRGEITNAQSYNRYTYVDNRPLSFTDPTGHGGCQSNSAETGCWNPGSQADGTDPLVHPEMEGVFILGGSQTAPSAGAASVRLATNSDGMTAQQFDKSGNEIGAVTGAASSRQAPENSIGGTETAAASYANATPVTPASQTETVVVEGKKSHPPVQEMRVNIIPVRIPHVNNAVKFMLDHPAPHRGAFVQVIDSHVKNPDGSTKRFKHFGEEWPVSEGHQQSDYSIANGYDDSFGVLNSGGSSGDFVIHGEVRYFDAVDLTAPEWQVGNEPDSGNIPSKQGDPGLPLDKATPAQSRDLIVPF